MKYIPGQIEKKWQETWNKAGLYKVNLKDTKNKYYLLVELPYPSGDLHMGHWFTFAVTDILGRLKRMQGYNVFFPVGFDAFGLPAENAAIKRGINPRDWTYSNIETMKKQFATMGGMHDFEHGMATCDPDYYRWNQWIFLKMFEKGLAYRGKVLSNWCPKDQTVLANENVEAGRCWRCGTEVVQKEVEQWMLKITEYAQRLIWGEKSEVDWPQPVREGQNNWIGKSEGIELDFPLESNIKRFVLLHGRNGSPHKDFFPWLKANLEKAGYEVFVPVLPNGQEPNDIEQAGFVGKNFQLDEGTIIVGHSFGGVVAMRLLEGAVKTSSVVLVSTPLSGKYLDKVDRPSVTAALKKGFDFEKIRGNAGNIKVLLDIGDDVVPIEDGRQLAKSLNAQLIEAKAVEGHFCGREEPVIWQNIKPAVRAFTKFPETIFGVTFMVVAPEHPIALEASKNKSEVKEYIENAQKKSELERTSLEKAKSGVFTGIYCVNPVDGRKVPVWVADYVIGSYGTGAVMGVPGSDVRDFDFAKKYDLPIIKVVARQKGDLSEIKTHEDVLEDGFMVNSGQFDGLAAQHPAKEKFIEYLVENGWGNLKVNYHLHDWSISRQRYWGTPIPIVHCPNCGTVPVPAKDLPVKLPEITDYAPHGKPPLAAAEDWVNVKCPNCGADAKREVDTMDTFVDSSWYFLRYVDPKNEKEIFDKKQVEKWLPVELYVGGAEHTLGHTLYSRFFVKFLHDIGQVPFEEYAYKRIHHGVILGPDGARMSKSKGNVVNPDEQVAQFGADAVRMYLAFMGPYDLVAPWNPNGLRGVYHFLQRVWELGENLELRNKNSELGSEDLLWMHKTIKKVSEDVEVTKYNTAVAALMEWMNYLGRKAHEGKGIKGIKSLVAIEEYKTLLLLLAPFAPHMTEELWQTLEGDKSNKGEEAKTSNTSNTSNTFNTSDSIHTQPWPSFDEKYIKTEKVTIVIQVNGKVRDRLLIEADSDQKTIEKLALASEKVQKFLGKKTPQKIIYIAGKLINFVV